MYILNDLNVVLFLVVHVGYQNTIPYVNILLDLISLLTSCVNNYNFKEVSKTTTKSCFSLDEESKKLHCPDLSFDKQLHILD